MRLDLAVILQTFRNALECVFLFALGVVIMM